MINMGVFQITFVVAVIASVVSARTASLTPPEDLNLLTEPADLDSLDREIGDPRESGTRVERSFDGPEERRIERQIKQLKKLKCKPHVKKELVHTYIHSDSPLKDKEFVPHYLPVKRCDPNCSVCGDPGKGKEVQKCQTARQRDKKFIVRYYDNRGVRKYHEVTVPVDTRCRCAVVA